MTQDQQARHEQLQLLGAREVPECAVFRDAWLERGEKIPSGWPRAAFVRSVVETWDDPDPVFRALARSALLVWLPEIVGDRDLGRRGGHVAVHAAPCVSWALRPASAGYWRRKAATYAVIGALDIHGPQRVTYIDPWRLPLPSLRQAVGHGQWVYRGSGAHTNAGVVRT